MMAMATAASAAAIAIIKTVKKNSIQFVRPQVFIKSNKIQANTIEHQLNAHEHSDQVPSGKKTEYADKEKGGTHKQNMI
jgi:hypothetical protein